MHKTTTMNKSTCNSFFVLVILFTLFSNTTSAQNAYTKLCLAAIEYEKAGKLDEAANKYSEAIKLKPDDWTGYSYRAKINLQRGNHDDAISDVAKAISLSPQTLSLYAVRANCLDAKGMHDKAIDDYNMALSKVSASDKEIYLTYFQRGRSYFYDKKYKEAVSDFDQALALAQKFQNSTERIYFFRAQAYMELNNFTAAIKDFDSFLTARPNEMEALLLQGYAFLKNGEKEKANAIALKIIQLDPSKEAYFTGSRLPEIFNLDFRREKSKQLTQDAQIFLSEQSTIPSKTLANIKINDAFRNLDTAWLLSPGLTNEDLNLKKTIRENFFIVYPLMKSKPEITELVRKYAVQATSATQEKKYDDAVTLWSTTLNISPYFPLAYYNRAMLYEMKGLLRYSISDMENYLKLMPEAADARSSRDKIYEWEGKIKNAPVAEQVSPRYGSINQIESKSYSPGNFIVAFGMGGSFGVQFAKNPALADLWTQNTAGATPDYKYSDKLPFIYSGDMELTVKPVKRIGIGMFGKLTGGIGARTKVSEVKYIMSMAAIQFGGLVRYYMILNNGAERPDLYLQAAFGQSKLNGYYGVATMDGIIFDYSYMKNFKGSAPYYSAGLGMGGKVGKHGYVTLSMDYINSKFEEISYEVTIPKALPGAVSSGTMNTIANYNGILLKFIFGVCF